MGNKKRLLTLLIIVTMLSMMSGCTKTEKTEEQISYTSETLGLFVAKSVTGTSFVVDSYGNQMQNYQIDQQGNITNSSQILIKQENVSEYKYLTAIISLNDTSEDKVVLSKRIKSGTIDEYEDSPTLYEYKVYVSPNNANHAEVRVRSSDTDKAELLQSKPGELSGDGSAVYESVEGVATIYIQCKKAGKVQITIESVDNSKVSTKFNLLIEETTAAVNTDNTEDNSIPTTENTTGYVLGTNVRFRERPDINSDIIAFYNTGKQLTILGADTQLNWTKCEIDRKTGYIKSEFVSRTVPTANTANQNGIYIVNTPKPTATPVPTATAAIAANDGNDHGLATGQQTENAIKEQEKIQNDTSHIHYYIKAETVAPSANSRGYTLYRCQCGASYKTNYTTR